MGSLNPAPELSLDFRPTFIPKTISQFLQQISTVGTSLSDKIFKLDDFVSRLESEMRKIDAFKRELPLCMLLVNDAIISLKEETMVLKKSSNNEPVLEQFIPLKKNYEDEDEESEIKKKENGGCGGGGDMKNWLSSTHLWNTNDQITEKRVENKDERMMGDSFQSPARAFNLFKGYCGFATTNEDKEELQIPGIKNSLRGSVLLSKTSDNSILFPSSVQNDQFNIPNGSQSSQQQSSRKQRRCWSTELHRLFVNALQQLGGSHAATPKQIRELMQVDGLTNDEVKSHLQKYRLHTRRLPSSNNSLSANQSGVVLRGGLWMSPQDQNVESSKHEISQWGSPDGPLVVGTTAGTSTTGGDSMDDGEDSKSENYCWKGV